MLASDYSAGSLYTNRLITVIIILAAIEPSDVLTTLP
jgi:hypothetical protein